jgi:hypothetical protein
MTRIRNVRAGGKRYKVRNLTFDELIMLGSRGATGMDSKQVVTELLSASLIAPKLTRNQIISLSDSVLAKLVVFVLELANVSARRTLHPYSRTLSHPRVMIA